MKKFVFASILPFLVHSQQPNSALPESSPSFEDVSLPTQNENIPAHFRVRVRSLTTTYASLNVPETLPKTKFLFSDEDITLSYIFPTYWDNVISLSVGYEYTLYKEKDYHFWDQENFHNGFFAVGIQNTYLNDWAFMTEVSGYYNLEKFAQLYYITGYTRYSINPCFGISGGAIYRTGIDSTRVWPIAGIDWTPNDTWELHLVYPIDISLTYHLNPCWAFTALGRLINNRQRVKDMDFLSDGILQYENYGAEFDVTYSYGPVFFVQLGAGCLFSGRLTAIAENPRFNQQFNQKPVPYINAQATLRF